MRPQLWRSQSEQTMSSPDDVGGRSVASAGARPRHFPPHWDGRGASSDGAAGWETAGGDSPSPSPALSGSGISLNSNRDSGYVPSPAGVVRFELDCGDSPSSPPPTTSVHEDQRRRRPVTQPIAIPCRPASGLPPPQESAILRRRLRQRLHHSPPPPPLLSTQDSSEDEGQGPEDHVADGETYGEDRGASGGNRGAYGEDRGAHREGREAHGEDRATYGEGKETYGEDRGAYGEDGVDYGEDYRYDRGKEEEGEHYREEEEEGERDEVDQAAAVSGEVSLLYREARSLHVGWREGAVLPPGFTFRVDLPDVIPPGGAAPEDVWSSSGGRAAEGAAVVSAPAHRQPPRSRASSASLSVELGVGRELREIADSLPLSRSAPGALLPRRDIWTLIRRTFDFGTRREMPPRPRRRSGR